MAFVIRNPIIGNQPIDETSTTQNHPFGTIVVADDATLGGGEFIYLKGVASTVVGSVVTYNMDDFTTTLLAQSAIGPVAIAMSINDAATDFGWYQIQGKGDAQANAAVADNADLYSSTTAGKIDDAVVAGDRIVNMKAAEAATVAGALFNVELERPFVDDVAT